MGRNRSIAFKYFSGVVKPGQKLQCFECKFCKKQVTHHATRMAQHLVTCVGCPDMIKTMLKRELNQKEKQNPNKRKNEESVSVSQSQAEAKEIKNTSKPSTSCKIQRMSSQSSLISSFIDNIKPDDQNEIWLMLAKAIYATGLPLNITENTYWVELFKKIRPSLTLPSRFILSNTLLNTVYNQVNLQVTDNLTNAKVLGIQCDGWSNIRNESIINFVITTPQPVFYKSLSAEENRHTGEYMADQIEIVFKEVGINKIIGFCSDNAANMKKSWDLLQNRYADKPISYYGCAAHTLNLLVTDIIKLKTTESVVNASKSIIKVIKNKSVLSSAFQRLSKEKHKSESCTLKLPVTTRWASIVTSFDSLQKNKGVLKAMAITDDYQELLERRNKNDILDDVFWTRIGNFLTLLQPLKKWILRLESDKCNISEVAVAFYEIDNVFKNELSTSPLLKMEEQKVTECLQERQKMCLRDIHFAANILDPRYKGKHLSQKDIVGGLTYIHSLAMYLEYVDESKLLENLAEYRSNEGFWALQFVQDCEKNPNILPLTYWKGICTEMPLRHIAETVLGMPASSAATERTFSSYGHIHTKTRNRLTTQRAGMLTYINHNLKLFPCLSSKNLNKDDSSLISIEKSIYSSMQQNQLETINNDERYEESTLTSTEPSTSTIIVADDDDDRESCTSTYTETTEENVSLIEEMEVALSKSLDDFDIDDCETEEL